MILTKKQTGFTIVETLIVIAVTGALFLSTSLLVSGQISRYHYRSSMFQLQSVIQSQLNSVQSGYFPDSALKKCDDSILDDINLLGTSTDCVIVGKKLTLLKEDESPDVGHPTTIKIETIGMDPLKIPLKTSDINEVNTKLKILNTQDIVIPGGLEYNKGANPTLTSPVTNNGDEIIIYALYSSAFSTNTNATAAALKSGAQQVTLYAVDLTPLPNSVNQVGRVGCFTDGSRYGSIVFGNSNSGFVTLNVEDPRCKF